MTYASLQIINIILLIFLTTIIYYVSAVGSDWNRSVKNILPSYYNVSTANVLRCGKLCERQGKCAAVTFDVRERKCYMHDTPVNETETKKGSTARYLIRNYSEGSKPNASENTCDEATQISLPTVYHKHGGCSDIMEKNECDPSPCQNDATCENTKNGYYCNCQAGYTGKDCSVEINECDSTPCQNNATCEDRINDYFCNCPKAFKGKNCSAAPCPTNKGYSLWTYPDMNLCIRYSNTAVNGQRDAWNQCGADGGHLVLIENESMRSHLVDIAKNLTVPAGKLTYIDGKLNTQLKWIDWKRHELTWLSWSTAYWSSGDCLGSNERADFFHVPLPCMSSFYHLLCQIDV